MDQPSESKGRLKDDGSSLSSSKKPSSTVTNDETPVYVEKNSDLPFLVTHWLANYEEKKSEKLSRDGKTTEAEAILRIRNAAKDLASAFADLGAYGSVIKSSHEKIKKHDCTLKNATYGDMKRKWKQVAPDQLESTVFSSTALTTVSHQHAIQRQHSTPMSILDAAYEDGINSKNRATGNNSNSDDGSTEVSKINSSQLVPHSMLHPPVLFSTNLDAAIADGTAKAVALKNDEERTRFRIGEPLSLLDDREIGPAGATIPPERQLVMTLGSDQIRVGTLAAQACRRSLILKLKLAEERSAIQSLKRSLNLQKKIKDDITKERMEKFGRCAVAAVCANQSSPPDYLLAKEQNADRIIAQLGRKMTELTTNLCRTESDFHLSKSVSKAMHDEFINLNKSFSDPFRAKARSSLPIRCLSHGSRPKSILAHTIGRQYCGVGKFNNMRRPPGTIPNFRDLSLLRKPILRKRYKYSVTINCHLFYPVYCLRFDRTGRYFVTGADDQLVKLFHLGSAPSALSRKSTGKLSCNIGANAPGAVLVCTLRGHAAVITDIDVSADNSLLATASEDGDVRVWGLKDGAPIAILRGHTGGANMVSWSVLSPFRLVTTGHDGFAKMWDVRKAALKRYGCMLSNRSDFTLPSLRLKDRKQVHNDNNGFDEKKNSASTTEYLETMSINNELPLPPIPLARERQSNNIILSNSNPLSQNSSNIGNSLNIPPLPPGAAQDNAINNVAVAGLNDNQAGNAPSVAGAFVANDNIDEGVTLLMKLQHGNIVSGEVSHGPGTRARRKTVKVICLSRCPVGGHFATGSDDGLGRIWADDDDDRIEDLDNFWRKSESSKFDGLAMTNLSRNASLQRHRGECRHKKQTIMRNGIAVPSKSNLLATLHGHLSSITDIVYSNAGDRILTASQKDGIVRIWSWGVETFVNKDGSMKFDDFKQILIRLTKPSHLNTSEKSGQSSRRRGSSLVNKGEIGQQSLGVSCDVASWTSDDSKVVTSQTCQVKATSTEIIPGSHVLHVWDSWTGQCLAGIHSSHSGACPVLVSHPLDSSILASAGSDGLVNVWDLDSGRCMFSHRNTLQHGPVEPPTDTGKSCAYLDGNFGPDGLHLVLTDDRGRITIIDALQSEGLKDFSFICASNSSQSTLSTLGMSAPAWMREQYFANDYYDLCYDINGYCIEKGSEKPPHLAPRAARCNYTASSYSADINESLSNVRGPMPLPEEDVRFARDNIRIRSVHIRRSGGILEENVKGKKTVINAESISVGKDRFGFRTNLYDAEILNEYNHTRSSQGIKVDRNQSSVPNEDTTNQIQDRPLSSRYRWSDYDDVLREEQFNGEDEKFDPDDEEYHANNNVMDISSSEDDADIESDNNESMTSPGRRRRNNGLSAQRRRHRRERQSRREQDNQRSPNSVEHTRRQSSRVSSRLSKFDYDESTDEDIIQYVSTNTKSPSGPYVKDYTVLGHFYIMPKDAPVNRQWVCRTEKPSSNKVYLPQVGDSVVYIPRAHFLTIQQFPTGNNESAPWKTWPTSTSWPVVRCKVKAIRFRFPFESYYRSKNDEVIISIVAILTLEITGIPPKADGKFPWPKAEFISRLPRFTNLTFEVSLFESNLAEFIVPEYLYMWRITTLENALNTNNIENMKFLSYFLDDETDGREDKPLIAYECSASYSKYDEENPPENDESHMRSSGFAVFDINFESNEGETDACVCSWELVPHGSEINTPKPNQLSEQENKRLIDILDEVERNPDVKTFFSCPVDTNIYSDYLDFVEVPIDLSLMRKRLKNSYYTTTLSVLADVMLIKENCIKYNGNSSPVTKNVNNMCDKFQHLFNKSMESTSTKLSRKRPQREEKEEVASSRTETHSVLQFLEPTQGSSSSSNLRKNQTTNTVNQFSSPRTRSHTQKQIEEDRLSDALSSTESIASVGHDSDSEADDFKEKSSETIFEIKRRQSNRIKAAVIARSEEKKVESAENNMRRKSSRARSHKFLDHPKEDSYETPSVEDSDSEDSYSCNSEEKKPVGRKTRSISSRNSLTRFSPRQTNIQEVKSDYSDPYNSDSSKQSSVRRVVGKKRPRGSHSDLSDDLSDDSSDNSNTLGGYGSDYSEYVPKPPPKTKTRKKRKSLKDSKPKSHEQYLPDIPIWPNRIVPADDLEDFCMHIMRKVEMFDVDKLFMKPVYEQYPQIADEYLSVVRKPMDFRTIIETRIQKYNTIKCLQDDLILTLRNCCNYNGENHDFWQYSVRIWAELTNIFKSVCYERNIDLPRRW